MIVYGVPSWWMFHCYVLFQENYFSFTNEEHIGHSPNYWLLVDRLTKAHLKLVNRSDDWTLASC